MPATETPALLLRQSDWQAIQAHAASLASEEACGLVAGRARRSLAILPVTNVDHSPTRYCMAPGELLQALIRIDEQSWELLAIYHSHPAGPPYISPIDIAEAHYPQALNLVLSPRPGGGWQCCAFWIRGQAAEPAQIEIIPDSQGNESS
jgi:proteasome lid subunit RPN8/RPN11